MPDGGGVRVRVRSRVSGLSSKWLFYYHDIMDGQGRKCEACDPILELEWKRLTARLERHLVRLGGLADGERERADWGNGFQDRLALMGSGRVDEIDSELAPDSVHHD